jgi:hypothetical protein
LLIGQRLCVPIRTLESGERTARGRRLALAPTHLATVRRGLGVRRLGSAARGPARPLLRARLAARNPRRQLTVARRLYCSILGVVANGSTWIRLVLQAGLLRAGIPH